MSDNFDWHSATLTNNTVLTENYKNTQNVRRFFKANLGEEFKFDRLFMAWVKSSTGKTLGDACSEYLALKSG